MKIDDRIGKLLAVLVRAIIDSPHNPIHVPIGKVGADIAAAVAPGAEYDRHLGVDMAALNQTKVFCLRHRFVL